MHVYIYNFCPKVTNFEEFIRIHQLIQIIQFHQK